MSAGRGSVRRLAAARGVSVAGSYAARIALVYEIYDRTGSSAWVTAVLLADVGIHGLLGPVSGWLGDRLPRRRLMVAAEVAAGVVYLALTSAAAPWVLVVGALGAAVVNAPFLPASAASIPNLVPTEDLRWANSMLALSQNGAMVVGPIVGGWLLAVSGIQLVFAVNAASYLASAWVIARTSGRFETDDGEHRHARPALRAGFVVAFTNPVVRTVTLALALTHLTFGVAMVADPALADEFGAGSFGYAALYTCWGAVALVGAWLAGRPMAARLVPYGVIAGLAAVTLACAVIAVLPWFWALVAVGSLGGVGTGALFPLTTGLIQQHTEDDVRARVFGASETAGRSAFALGMIAGAPVVGTLGGQGAYAVIAVLLAVATAGMLGLPGAVAGSLRARPAVKVGR